MDHIAGLIVTARARSGLSQRELAVAAGTSQPAVNRYERGLSLPTLPTLERLLAACGSSLAISDVGNSRRRPSTSVRGGLGPAATALRRARPRLLAAAQRNGVRNVRVFGSVARGTESASSDIDLLVELAPGRTLLDVAGFRLDASAILGVDVDVATTEMLKERVRESAVRDAVRL
jgi:uncharacterized protein